MSHRVAPTVVVDPNARYLTHEESTALLQRVVSLASKGGDVGITVRATWKGVVQWGRNRITHTSETMATTVSITRVIDGAAASIETSQLDVPSLTEAVRRAEKQAFFGQRSPLTPMLTPQHYLAPKLWSDATFGLDAQGRSDSAWTGVSDVAKTKRFAAGTLQTRVVTWACLNTLGLDAYATQTGAQYAQSVRDTGTNGVGRVSLSHVDWTHIDVPSLSRRSLETCIATGNPRAIEPGRYTAILAPAAVSSFMGALMTGMDQARADGGQLFKEPVGTQFFPEAVSLVSDPADTDGAFIPFDAEGAPYTAMTWFEKGRKRALPYDRAYAEQHFGRGSLPHGNPFAFRMTGGDATMEQLVADVERGLLISAFGEITYSPILDQSDVVVSGATAYGLWFIQHGKISLAAKNLLFAERALTAMRRVLRVGRPERVAGVRGTFPDMNEYAAPSMALGLAPVVVPPLVIRDFNFVALADAV